MHSPPPWEPWRGPGVRWSSANGAPTGSGLRERLCGRTCSDFPSGPPAGTAFSDWPWPPSRPAALFHFPGPPSTLLPSSATGGFLAGRLKAIIIRILLTQY